MPIYQYKCTDCGAEFQDVAIEYCQSCKSYNLRSAHATANMQFGGGVDPIHKLRREFDKVHWNRRK